MMRKTFSVSGRIHSVRYALSGIWVMLKTQHNAGIHAAATVAVLLVGWWVGVPPIEWSWLLLAMVAVWMAESLNTALELLADAVAPEFHPLVKQAKDIAAGAVLIAATGAAVVGLLVMGPRLWDRLF